MISLGKDVVFIAHASEDQNGDQIIYRPDLGGKNRNELYRIADVMGYLTTVTTGEGKNARVINFKPSPTHHAKNSGALGGETGEVWVPDLKAHPTFLADLITQAKDHINTLTPAQLAAAKAQEELENWKQSCEEAEHAGDLNQLTESLDKEHMYYQNMRQAMLMRAKALNCTFDKQRGTWISPPEFNGISDQQRDELQNFIAERGLDVKTVCEHIAFIGPTSSQMLDFGLKHTARELAIKSNVPLLPGSSLLADEAEALTEAARIGYPVMLKSTAGGGGIGMRLVWNETELKDAYQTVSYLAQVNFKDAGLYLEKFVQHARHIEVQIFGDGQGQVLALGERDCSVQRRNQKVIEETPAPHLNEQQRDYLQKVAIQLMQSVNYRSAGTVEFVMDTETQEFYFLEVNTRLQVEHGVTEQVFGVDLVEWMVTLASGDWSAPTEKLEPTGHSIQVRLYAEDPIKQFQPSAGLLTHVKFDPQARVETWVETGSTVSSFYDPMIAKIIVTAATRDQAIQAMSASLANTQVAGIETNLEYLQNIAL